MKEHEKIAVLDFGGQYAHLIASRLRALGAFSEIVRPDALTPERAADDFRGLIYSGGPSSVYEPGAPTADPRLLGVGIPVLAICYGHQLVMQQLGAVVEAAAGSEFGPAELTLRAPEGLFAGEEGHSPAQVWMSHGDEVRTLPDGFVQLGSTDDCEFAAVGDVARRLFAVQFHPEVTDTVRGAAYLSNFVRMCGLEGSWSLEGFLAEETRLLAERIKDKSVFLLVSGGVDSTVAYALLSRAVPPERLRGLLVDTGFMREGEVAEVERALRPLGVQLEVQDASESYYSALAGVAEPEKKRNIIGELFIDVQSEVSERLGLNPVDWYLGQGTIYPDRIESGATAHSHRIKTHHNRVARIEAMIEQGRVVEPIGELYKDEVRRVGRLLGLGPDLVDRHPFPGPGLAVRCLCLETPFPVPPQVSEAVEGSTSAIAHACAAAGFAVRVLPLRSVGVQGDRRTYAKPVALFGRALDWAPLARLARAIPNRVSAVNRVLYCAGARYAMPPEQLPFGVRVPAFLTRERVAVLRRADHIVTSFIREQGVYDAIWQFPVVLAPLGAPGAPDSPQGPESVILRPVDSTEAMTAGFHRLDFGLLEKLTERLLAIDEVAAVFYDLTTKPPGTIEWE